MSFEGKVWCFGDNVDTDQILPGKYINIMNREERASHCMEYLFPDFAKKVLPGDFVIAGENFGCGSSRPSLEILEDLKVKAIIAKSFARIFFRNGIVRGFSLIQCKQIDHCNFENGNLAKLDLENNLLINMNKKRESSIMPYPEFLKNYMQSGGLLNFVKKQIKKNN